MTHLLCLAWLLLSLSVAVNAIPKITHHQKGTYGGDTSSSEEEYRKHVKDNYKESDTVPDIMNWPSKEDGEEELTSDWFKTMIDIRSCCISGPKSKWQMYIVNGNKTLAAVGDSEANLAGWRMKLWKAKLKGKEYMIQFDDPNISIFSLATGGVLAQVNGPIYRGKTSHFDHCFVLGDRYAFLDKDTIFDLEKLLTITDENLEDQFKTTYDAIEGIKIGNSTLTKKWIDRIRNECFDESNDEDKTYCAPYLENTQPDSDKPLWIGKGQRLLVIGDDTAYLKAECGSTDYNSNDKNHRCHYYVIQNKPTFKRFGIRQNYYLNEYTKIPESQSQIGYRVALYPFIRHTDVIVKNVTQNTTNTVKLEGPHSIQIVVPQKEFEIIFDWSQVGEKYYNRSDVQFEIIIGGNGCVLKYTTNEYENGYEGKHLVINGDSKSIFDKRYSLVHAKSSDKIKAIGVDPKNSDDENYEYECKPQFDENSVPGQYVLNVSLVGDVHQKLFLELPGQIFNPPSIVIVNGTGYDNVITFNNANIYIKNLLANFFGNWGWN